MTPPDGHRTASYYVIDRLRRTRRWPWIIGTVLWLAIGAGLGVALTGLDTLNDTVEELQPAEPIARAVEKVADKELPDKPINVLLIGSDKRPSKNGTGGERGRSDSLSLVRMDFQNDFISILGFPRDLWVNIPGHGQAKINEAFSIGGPAKTMETVKALTGEPIQYYFNVDFIGFRNIVNAVGGVYLDVDRRYLNVNNPGEVAFDEIDLQAGYQRLNGDQALDFARYRHTDSDRARIARQQHFLSEFKRQSKRFDNVLELRKLAGFVAKSADSNIKSTGKFLDIMRLAIQVDKSRTFREYVKGANGFNSATQQSIVVFDQSEVEERVEEWKNPVFEQATPRRAIKPADVSVGVINGSGRLLGADDVADRLRERGYQAFAAGNQIGRNRIDFTHRGSKVYYAPDKRDAAQAVRALLGTRAGIAAQPLAFGNALTRSADVVVVVGSEFKELTAPASGPGATKATPDVVSTLALVDTVSRAQSLSGMRLLVPTKVARQSRVRIVRPYTINSPGKGSPALRIVFDQFPRPQSYWTITQTSWKNPPILEGRVGVVRRKECKAREFSTYYDGKNLMRLAFRQGDMVYWISNTLPGDNGYLLSAETMYAIGCGMKPVNRATLGKGETAVDMSITTDSLTP